MFKKLPWCVVDRPLTLPFNYAIDPNLHGTRLNRKGGRVAEGAALEKQ